MGESFRRVCYCRFHHEVRLYKIALKMFHSSRVCQLTAVNSLHVDSLQIIQDNLDCARC